MLIFRKGTYPKHSQAKKKNRIVFKIGFGLIGSVSHFFLVKLTYTCIHQLHQQTLAPIGLVTIKHFAIS